MVDDTEHLNILFPHEKIREEQNKFISDVKETINNKKNLLAHAPTGLGKTASILSVAIPYALEKDKVIFFLTNRHTQHKIVIDTLKDIKKKFSKEIISVDLIGKKWMCNQEVAGLFGNEFNEYCKSIVNKGECEYYNKVYKKKKELSVEAKFGIVKLKEKSPMDNEELQTFCKQENFCSYEMSLTLAKKADIIIGDYYYLFNPVVSGTILQKLGIKLEDIILIVDEGHNLPNRIVEMLSSNLTTNMIKNSIQEAKKFNYESLVSWLQSINNVLIELGTFSDNNKNGFYNKINSSEKIIDKNSFYSKVNKIIDYKYLIEELETAADEIRKKQKKSFIGGVSNFLSSWLGEGSGFTRIIAEKEGRVGKYLSLQYLCLDPSVISTSIFNNIHSSILMSGTLQPTNMYKNLLGISESIEKNYQSPFPPENKISLIIPETSTKFTVRSESMFIKIAEHCANVCNIVPGNVALFFPSYHLRDKISYHVEEKIKGKKIFWEKQEMSKQDKEQFLLDFKRNSFPGAVLLGVTGANFAEGVDFPGDLLKAVVVIGLPLGRPDLKTKETINYYQQKFGKGWAYAYTNPAMNKCIQSSGRCIRSETDKGAVIYLDERFTWSNYFDCLPKEGLIVSKDYMSHLERFFGN